MKTNVLKLMTVALAVTLMACSSEDLFDGKAVEDLQRTSYAENFVKKYPNVDLSQSWDFSSKQSIFSLGNMTGNNVTRARSAQSGTFTERGWYEVENTTLEWMHEKLVEGQDNRALGKPFYMSVPGNDFTIVPIYQGGAAAVWELHMVVDGLDYTVWTKSQDVEIKDVESQQWHSCIQPTYEWDQTNGTDWESLHNTDGSDKRARNGELNIVNAVRAKNYVFSGLPVGAEMYFYLKVLVGDADRCEVGAEQSSIKGMMLALQEVPIPQNIPSDNEAMIIACEDADLSLSDWDMNDVVFLVYGKRVPKPVEITEGDQVERRKTVRYMIEDLGATDDFDFNDIVVDVADIDIVSPVYTNGVLTSWNTKGHRQEAVIRHLGGTLPFKLRIGNTEFEEHQGVLGADPNEKYEISGWNINTHNISVQVQQNNNSGVYNNVTFPKVGEAPMIIAVDPSQAWMSERRSVPESWFYIPSE